MSNDALPLTMTVAQIAKLLGVSKNTAYKLVRSMSLRSIRIGRQIRVPRSALEDYLNGITPERSQSA